MARPTRRIVAGHAAEGRSIIPKDGSVPSIFEPTAQAGAAIPERWRRASAATKPSARPSSLSTPRAQ